MLNVFVHSVRDLVKNFPETSFFWSYFRKSASSCYSCLYLLSRLPIQLSLLCWVAFLICGTPAFCWNSRNCVECKHTICLHSTQFLRNCMWDATFLILWLLKISTCKCDLCSHLYSNLIRYRECSLKICFPQNFKGIIPFSWALSIADVKFNDSLILILFQMTWSAFPFCFLLWAMIIGGSRFTVTGGLFQSEILRLSNEQNLLCHSD